MSSEQRPIQAVVAGHICLDLSPFFTGQGAGKMQDILIPGKLINVGEVNLSTGGPVSNTGISLNMLGIETRLMGKTGDDAFGGIVRRILGGYGITEGMIVDPDAATSYSMVIAPPGVDRIFLHFTGANDTFVADDLNLALISQSRLFHFGYPPLMRSMFAHDGEELEKVYRMVKSTGTTTSLDMALPDPASPAGQADWPLILSKVLPWTDICLPSIEELLFMMDRPLFEQARAAAGDRDILHFLDFGVIPDLAGRMLAMGTRIAVIKLGRYGYYVRTADPASLAGIGPASPADPVNWGNREIWCENFDVTNIVSTSGAGDASIAGFLAGLLTGQRIETAAHLACAAAALKIQVKASVGGLIPYDRIIQKMADWPKEPLSLDGGAWRYDGKERLWFGKNDRPAKTG